MNQTSLEEANNAKKPKPEKHPNPVRAVFNENEAGAYIDLSPSNLRKGRMNGKRDNHVDPPPYVKLGRRIGYLRADLDAWLMSHRVGV